MESLPEREHLIVRQHYLAGMDFERIAALLQISKGRVSQIHRAALIRLKDALRRSGDFGLER